MCVQSGRVARPVRLAPKESWSGVMTLAVEDRVYAEDIFDWGRAAKLKPPAWMAEDEYVVRLEEDGFFRREFMDMYKDDKY